MSLSHVAHVALRRAAPVVFLFFVLSPQHYSLAQSHDEQDDRRRDDVVQARQFLMDAIDEQIGPLDLAAAGKASDLDSLKSRAYLINTLIAAFPHLFPPGTRPADIPESGIQTSATPAVWDRFDAFYELSQAAAEAAYEASQASDEASLRTHASALRKACDTCHAEFMAAPASPVTK